MKLKEIFSKGTQELKRRARQFREKRNLTNLEKKYSLELIHLGKKAWELKVDISSFGNLSDLIEDIQKQYDQLNINLQSEEKVKVEIVEKIKGENNAFESQIIKVGKIKKELDFKLNQEERDLRDEKDKVNKANTRLGQIREEEEELKLKLSKNDLSEMDRNEKQRKIEGFIPEREELAKEIDEISKKTRKITNNITPLKIEAGKRQNEIDGIKVEQMEVVGKLEVNLKKVLDEIGQIEVKKGELNKEREGFFEKLGKKLSNPDISEKSIKKELSTVKDTESKIQKINDKLKGLKESATADYNSAFWQMIAITGGGIILIIIIVLLILSIF